MPPEELKEPAATPPVSAPSSPLKQIRTYQGDIAELLKHDSKSIESIRQEERAKAARVALTAANGPREAVSPEVQASRKSGLLLFFGILLLLAAGGGAGWYAYTLYKTKTAPPVVAVVPNAIIAPDSVADVEAINSSRDQLISLLQSKRSEVTSGHLSEVLLHSATSSGILKTDSYLTFIQSRAPGALVRALDPVFMQGVLGDQKGGHVFLLIPLDSFENAYPGMLAWEPDMRDDLLPLFASASSTDAVPSETVWKDLIVENKNTRVLKASDNTTALLYTFYNNSLLIITDNETTIKALLGRLNAQQLSR